MSHSYPPRKPSHKPVPGTDEQSTDESIQPEDLPRQALEPILGGTLCLLTLNVLGQDDDSSAPAKMNPFVCRKIASNLVQLSSHPAVSTEFQRVCQRLVRRWYDHFGDDTSMDIAQWSALAAMQTSRTRH